MKWSEFKEKVENELAANGVDDAEIDWFNFTGYDDVEVSLLKDGLVSR